MRLVKISLLALAPVCALLLFLATTASAQTVTLTNSGSITASSNGQVIENLNITATTGHGINVNGKSDVIIRNVKISHRGGAGISASNAARLRIQNVDITYTGSPASGANPGEFNNINLFDSSDVVVTNARLTRGSTGIYLVNSPRANLSFIEGHDFRGPFPRGQVVQFNASHNGILSDFSVINPINTSWTEDNVNVYHSNAVTIQRGFIDGNNSPTGVGVIIEADGVANASLVEDVDTIRMGNGAFSQSSGTVDGSGSVFRRVRSRENICGNLAGRGTPSSNALMFHSYNGAQHTRFEQAQYWLSCNGNIAWDQGTMDVADFSQVNYTQRSPIVLVFPWESVGGGDTTAPSTPTNLTATAASASQINLTWTASTDNVGVTGYRVFRGGTQVGTPTGTSFSDTGLTPSTAYSYTVKAIDAAGNLSANSSTASATTHAGLACSSVGTNAFFGCYFDNIDFTNLVITRTDAAINFDWGTGSPDPSIGSDTFSVRWQGNFTFSAGTYTFTAITDDGMRVYVDDQLVLDKWFPQSETTYTFPVTLTAGTHLVKVEYFEDGVGAVAKLSWVPNFTPPVTSTLGYATVGSILDTYESNYINLSRFTTDASGGQATSMSVYVASPVGAAPNNQYSMAIYADAAGAPGTKIANTSNGTIITNAWNTLPISATLAPNTTYWLGYNTNGTASNQNNMKADTGSTNQEAWMPKTFGAWPQTFGPVDGRSNLKFSIYATLTSGTGSDTVPPSVPTGLTATAASATQINLTWTASTDNVGVTGYRVFRNGSQVGTPTGTSYSDTGLTASTAYSYYVRAVDAAGNVSGNSNTASAMTQAVPDTQAPSVPTNLAATAISTTQINLSWTASTDNVGVTGYKIFRGGTQVGTSVTNSFSNTGLSPATAYTYTVSAYDAAGNNSAQSSSASATTLPLPPTAIISATPQAIGSGDSATLSWSSTGATSCTGTNFSTGGTVSGSVVVTPAATTVYTVSCTGAGGTGTNNVTVTVGALSALPTIGFPSGTFTWTTTDAVSCTASGGWTGSVGTSGSYTFSTPVSTTYVLTCTGGGTTVQRTITITTSETATVSSKFQSGQNVTTTSAVNVRTTPSTSGTLLGTQSTGAQGTVTGGPVQANGYWWWQVNYASGPDGWSVENWLQ